MHERTKSIAVCRNSKLLSARFVACLVPPMLLISGCQTPAERNANEAAVARATKGKALFEEKCRTVAGEKIYRTVRDVAGVLLLKVRPARGDRELADQMWPGAAFALESSGDEYIKTFLGYEYAPGNGLSGKPGKITAQNRGYVAIDRRPGGRSGYRFVDVLNGRDGQRYRYSLVQKPRPTSRIGWIDIVLHKTTTSDVAPRYGVIFEDYVIPEERYLGIAASTVKVLDLQTHELLGQLTRYAWSPGGPSAANPTPWLTAYRCPDQAVGTNAATRKFVDRILIPSSLSSSCTNEGC